MDMMKNLSVFCLLLVAGCIIGQTSAYTWCCTSRAEYRKCSAFAARRDQSGGKIFDFDCLQADGTDACMQHIKSGEADVIDIDGGDIFEYRDDVTIVAAENVGYADASYFAVAVVTKGASPELTLANLDGAKTCHTGVGKTSGWNMPMGWLIRHGFDPARIGASCAPGAGDEKYAGIIPGGPDPKWCSLCVGDDDGEDKCSRSAAERYYGYHGAFKCMTDGVGDVAFIKQTIIPPEEAHKYELLCPDAPRRSSPLDWETCHLGRVPAHAVVMSNRASSRDAATVYAKLTSAWNQLGDRNSYGRGKNILWGSKVRYFMYMDRMAPRTYMQDDYFCSMHELYTKSKHPSCL